MEHQHQTRVGEIDWEQLKTKIKERGSKKGMTKVATIDTKRVLCLVMVAAMLIATLLVAMIPTIVSAALEGTTGGSFTTNDSSSPPLINSVGLFTTADVSTTTMDPTVEYWIKVDVTDNQTLEHLASVQVTIFYDSTADNSTAPVVVNNQTCAIMTWDNTSTWTHTSMPSGSTWSFHDGNQPILTNNTGTFTFHFVPGKVATESSGAYNWDIYAKATDEAPATDDLYLRDMGMNWYGEISGVTDSVNWSSISLNTEEMAGPLSAKYICNGNYSEQAKTDAQWINGSYYVDLVTSGSPGNGEFTLWVNDESDSSAETQLTDSYGDIDGDETITAEDGDTNGNMHLFLTLGPSGIASGTYTGDINFAIYNR
jgi:hypothetical protein